jgi:hypothetical protein
MRIEYKPTEEINIDKLKEFDLRDIYYIIAEAELDHYITKEQAKEEFFELMRLVKNILVTYANKK